MTSRPHWSTSPSAKGACPTGALKRRVDLDDDLARSRLSASRPRRWRLMRGHVLVWAGSRARAVGASREQGRTPGVYTLAHFAEKIMPRGRALRHGPFRKPHVLHPQDVTQ